MPMVGLSFGRFDFDFWVVHDLPGFFRAFQLSTLKVKLACKKNVFEQLADVFAGALLRFSLMFLRFLTQTFPSEDISSRREISQDSWGLWVSKEMYLPQTASYTLSDFLWNGFYHTATEMDGKDGEGRSNVFAKARDFS